MHSSTVGLTPRLSDSSESCNYVIDNVNQRRASAYADGPALPLGAGWPVRCLQHSVMTEAEEYADAVDRT